MRLELTLPLALATCGLLPGSARAADSAGSGTPIPAAAAEAGSDGRPPALATTMPASHAQLQFALGRRDVTTLGDGSWAAQGSFPIGLTDRLQWPFLTPAVSYRFGDRGGVETIVSGGMTGYGVGWSSSEGLIAVYWLGAHLDGRWWLADDHAVNLSLAETTINSHSRPRTDVFSTFTTRLAVGHSSLFFDVVAVHAGVRAQASLVTGENPGITGASIAVGSVQEIGLRPLPLVQVYALPTLSVDAWGSLTWDIDQQALVDEILFGFSWFF